MISEAHFLALPFEDRQRIVDDLIDKAVKDANAVIMQTSDQIDENGVSTLIAIAGLSLLYEHLLNGMVTAMRKDNGGDNHLSASTILEHYRNRIVPLVEELAELTGEVNPRVAANAAAVFGKEKASLDRINEFADALGGKGKDKDIGPDHP